MKFSTISNIGKVRSENQDYYGNLELDKYSFFIVADGMGGYNGGELASKLAAKYYIEYIKNSNMEDFSSIIDLQEEAFQSANDKILYQNLMNNMQIWAQLLFVFVLIMIKNLII